MSKQVQVSRSWSIEVHGSVLEQIVVDMDNRILARHSRDELFVHEECELLLERILAGGEGGPGRLVSFEVKPELNTIGYLGEYFQLNLRYELEKNNAKSEGSNSILEKLVFVKSMPYMSPDMCYYIEKSGILKKEATLYETLLNELRKLSKNIWCAQWYYTRKDLFVMENIVNLGFEPLPDSSAFLDQTQLKALLKGLAAIHASSIAYEVRNGVSIGEQLKDVLYEVTVLPTVEWYTTGLKAVLAVALEHPNYQSSAIQSRIKNEFQQHVDAAYEMVNPSVKYRNVFCHRDAWGGNVFFRRTAAADEQSVILVDYQLCRYSPPAIDVLMALYMNLKPQERKRTMAENCKCYYDHFAAELRRFNINPEEHMSWLAFQQSMGDMELFGALYNCLSATILRVPKEFLTKMKQHQPEDFHRYVNVDRTEAVLQLVRTHQDFRNYLRECIEDFLTITLK